MNTLAQSHGWSGRALASNPLIFAAFVLARRVRRTLKVRADRRKLQGMPDYLLADIGLRRSDIEDEMSRGPVHPLGPSYRL